MARWAALLALILGIALAVRAFVGYWGTWGNWSECALVKAFQIESFEESASVSDFRHIYNRGVLRLSPRWTPDGAHIVFTTQKGGDLRGTSQVHVIAADGSGLMTIGEELDTNHSPLISHDGTSVMYSTHNEVNDARRYFEIETSALDGSNQKRLTHQVGFDVPSDWPHNDSRIAFTRDAESVCTHDYSDIGLYTMRSDGSDVRRVVPGKDSGISGRDILTGTMSWSPDRQTVALLVNETLPVGSSTSPRNSYKRTSLVTVDVRDSSMTRLVTEEKRPMFSTKPSSLVGPLVWSPDGARITFLRRQDPPHRLKLYSVNHDGSDLREVVGPDADYARRGGRRVSWSPHRDGPQIMFSPSDPLYIVHVDGAEHKVLRTDHLHAAWSPDGSRVAVVVPGGQSVVLYTVAPDGSSVNVLVRRRGDGGLEAIGPDQRRSADITDCSAGVVVPDPAFNPELVRDCEALVQVMDRIAVAGLNWEPDVPILEWEGVGVDDRDTDSNVPYPPLRVRELSLPGRGVIGTFPASVTGLAGLLTLDLSNNNLFGDIPPALNKLTDLRTLDLGGNSLSGTIPRELGGLAKLDVLDLSGNRLSGPIPPELGTLAELDLLDFSDTRMGGTIPRELGKLEELEVLNIRRASLEGEIPREVGDLTTLEVLDLSYNELIGDIPPELGNLSALKELELRNNRLSGPIPVELGNLLALKVLTLDFNRLSGPIPAEFRNLTALETLDLSSNPDISGCIPLAWESPLKGYSGMPRCDQ